MKHSSEHAGGQNSSIWKLLAVLGASLVACMILVRGCKDNSLSAFAEGFKRGTITMTFMASMPNVSRERGGLLELATATATENFQKKDNLTYDFRFFEQDMGTTKAWIQVPVTYRYHLRLSESWRLDIVSNMCVAYVPSIRPSLPPAIDTEKMIKSVVEPKTRFNGRELLDSLERSITPRLNEYAGDPQHIDAVREKCRLTAAEFVRAWLLREEHWREDRFTSVKVIFADEIFKSPDFQPTLELNK